MTTKNQSNDIVGAFTTFGKLKKVIIGSMPGKTYYENVIDRQTREQLQQISEETVEDLNNLKGCVENFGVEVYQLENHFDQPGVYDNGKTKILNPRPPITPRDNIDFIGNKMLSCFNWQQPARFFDDYAHNKLFGSWFRQGAEWYQMPKGWFNHEEIEVASKIHPFPGESHPFLDSSNLLKLGNRIYASTYNSSNKLGLRWLQNVLGDEISVIDVSDGKNFVNHIDCLIKVLRPGLAISKFPKELIVKQRPEFEKWEIIYVPMENRIDSLWSTIGDYKGQNGIPIVFDSKLFGEKWLNEWVDDDINNTHFDIDSLAIDENNLVVSGESIEFERLMKKYNINTHSVRFKHQFFWGFGVNCLFSDVKREDECIDYFK